MKIKKIKFIKKITDVYNNSIDVLIKNKNGYKYIIIVGTP